MDVKQFSQEIWASKQKNKHRHHKISQTEQNLHSTDLDNEGSKARKSKVTKEDRSVIIFGLPELISGTEKEKLQHDIDAVCEYYSLCSLDWNNATVKRTKTGTDGCRPLMVTMADVESRDEFLAAFEDIQQSRSHLKDIRIRPAFTKQEMEKMYCENQAKIKEINSK
jgi:uncharacterized protein (UPF0210 family)|uniref:Uncharacterized protein n=1 Tax=Panagrolaimus sp. PS1159 TaxID=55785 RepID=A0AC35FEU0_9BILA